MKNKYFSIFGGQDINLSNVEPNDVNLTAVFGGINLDFRNSVIKKDIHIKTTAIFGGTDVK